MLQFQILNRQRGDTWVDKLRQYGHLTEDSGRRSRTNPTHNPPSLVEDYKQNNPDHNNQHHNHTNHPTGTTHTLSNYGGKTDLKFDTRHR